MRFFVILLLFCVGLAGSAAVAVYGLRSNVEEELRTLSRKVLGEAGFGGVEVEFDHLQGSLSGHVDDPADIPKVLALLSEKVPTAYWPAADATSVRIRPTLPPRLEVSRSPDSDTAVVQGVLGPDGESARVLLGTRLRSLPGIAKVDNSVSIDPRHLSFPKMAEYASLASGLLAHPGESRLVLKDGALRVTGTVPNEGIKLGLLDLAASIGAGEVVDEIEIRVPDTFLRLSELRITRNRFGVTLAGVFPDEPSRTGLLDSLRRTSPSVQFVDKITVGENCGASAWQGRLGELVPILLESLSGEMTAEFTPSQIRLDGVTRDEATRTALLAKFEPLVRGEPPFELVVALDVSGGSRLMESELTAEFEAKRLSLSGRLPGEGFGASVKVALAAAFPDVTLEDKVLSIPGAASADWVGKLPGFFAEALGRLESGKFTLSKGTFQLEGRTLELPDRQILQNLAVNSLPTEVKIRNSLLHKDQPFPKPDLLPEERTKLAEALKPLPVYFDTGSVSLSDEGRETVASIAKLVQPASGRVGLLVTGFADNVGREESNRELAAKRAESVIAELKKLGITGESLSAASAIEDVSDLPRSQRGKARRAEVTPKPAAATTAPPPNP